MKIAILIAGEYREFPTACKYWSFLQWKDIDVYFSTWNKSVRIFDDIKKQNETELIVSSDLTNFVNVKDYIISNIDDVYYNCSAGYMIDRWKSVINLMINSNINYDGVLLIRPDLVLEYNDTELFNFFKKSIKDHNIIYTVTYTDPNKSLDIENTNFMPDLFYFGSFDAITKLVDLPIDHYKLNIKNSEFQNFPTEIESGHSFLSKHFVKYYNKILNIPCTKQIIVRSNSRLLKNLSFSDLENLSKNWYEKRYKKFHSKSVQNYYSCPQSTHYEIKYGSIFHEEFSNKYDKNYGSDNLEKLSLKNYNKDDISYKFNKKGLRVFSEQGPSELEDKDQYPLLVVAGDSSTFGVGLPVEHIYFSFLVSHIQSSQSIELPIFVYNVSHENYSLKDILLGMYDILINEKIFPNLVLIQIPKNFNSDDYIFLILIKFLFDKFNVKFYFHEFFNFLKSPIPEIIKDHYLKIRIRNVPSVFSQTADRTGKYLGPNFHLAYSKMLYYELTKKINIDKEFNRTTI